MAVSELRFEDPALPADAIDISQRLETFGMAAFHYAAFGTGWRMLALDQGIITPETVFGSGYPTGIAQGGYTLWLRDDGQGMQGPWLHRDAVHVPEYLAEKFSGMNVIDGLGIGVLIALVDAAQTGRKRPDKNIKAWADHAGRSDALPAFLEEGSP